MLALYSRIIGRRHDAALNPGESGLGHRRHRRAEGFFSARANTGPASLPWPRKAPLSRSSSSSSAVAFLNEMRSSRCAREISPIDSPPCDSAVACASLLAIRMAHPPGDRSFDPKRSITNGCSSALFRGILCVRVDCHGTKSRETVRSTWQIWRPFSRKALAALLLSVLMPNGGRSGSFDFPIKRNLRIDLLYEEVMIAFCEQLQLVTRRQ